MKTGLKPIGLIIAILLGFVNTSTAQSKKKADNDTRNWRYEIEAVGVGTQGSYLIKVWSYSKNKNVAIEQAKKNAVHGVVFKGFTGKQGIPGQKPLALNSNLEQERAEFFIPFFENGGKYLKFVSLADDGSVAAGDRMKVGKEYKIGVIVSVSVGLLRKDLEDAGIIRGLSNGF